jgi:methyl-accepting chemotaxis protein
MTQTTRIIGSLLAVLLLSAPAALAAEPARPGATPGDGLTPQERDLLAVAQEFASRATEAIDKWLASKETTEEALFSFLYYPQPKTDPPKFNTSWDRLSDRDIQGIEEAIKGKSQSIVYAVMVDRNGYLPTHNLEFSQVPTNDPAVDLVKSRTKRIFNDRTGLAAARSQAPYLVQRYLRDTGEAMGDLSVPLYVRGNHWGAVRIGYRAAEAR